LSRSDLDNREESFKPNEVLSIASDQGKLLRKGTRSDQQVGESTTRLPALVQHRSMDASIGSGSFEVERERIEGRLRSLEPILAARSFLWVIGG
jgi:hypothetical protein